MMIIGLNLKTQIKIFCNAASSTENITKSPVIQAGLCHCLSYNMAAFNNVSCVLPFCPLFLQ